MKMKSKSKKGIREGSSQIRKGDKIGEIVEKYPETVQAFAANGLHCIGCMVSSYETIEQGAKAHGIDIKKLLKDLNKAIKK